MKRHSFSVTPLDKDWAFCIVKSQALDRLFRDKAAPTHYKRVHPSELHSNAPCPILHRSASRIGETVSDGLHGEVNLLTNQNGSMTSAELQANVKTHKPRGQVCLRPLLVVIFFLL